MSKPVLRGKTWYLKRRVPKRYAQVEPRLVIWDSLKTDSYSVAVQKSAGVWLSYIEGWEARLAGRDDDAAVKFRAAQQLAAIQGFQFLSMAKVEQAPLEEIMLRVEASRNANGAPDAAVASALLGAVEAPKLKLSGLVEHAETLAAHDNRFKNNEQMRLWRTPRQRAVNNLMSALGKDIAVASIGSTEARAWKKWWKARIAREGQSSETANKDFTYMNGMFGRFYEDLEHEDPPRPFAGISIRDRHAKPSQKLEVPVDWIVEKWFAPGALDGLNEEARDILLISIETGCRQNEIYNLPPSAICLTDPIPHLRIAHEASDHPDERREVKNLSSHREIPLVGVALAAAKRHPDGFPRYRNKSSYSASVNKYLRENGMLPVGVTIGGTRHSWESRMKRAGYQMDDRGELMGHSLKASRGRETYGDSMSLADRLLIAQEVMLSTPEHFT
jgi:integrase